MHLNLFQNILIFEINFNTKMNQYDVSGDNKNIGDIMTNYEAELLIEVLRAFPIEEYGCKA